jgi:subtilase family serine protease
MEDISMTRPNAARSLSLLVTPLTTIALALATMSTHAAAPAQVRDLGVVAPSTAVSAVIWLKGNNDAAFDAAAAALSDSSAPTYHKWMQDSDIAAYAPSAQDVANARASFTALGLSVEKVFDGGTMMRVSGSATQMQAAFGTTIHAVQTAEGTTLFKAVTAPSYKGAHAELVGGVSGLSGAVTKPYVARQTNFITGVPMPLTVAQVGTDPLAAFTTKCFGPNYTETMAGFGGIGGVEAGGVVSTATGITYLDPTKTTNRLTCGYTAQQLVAHYGVNEAHAFGLKGKGQTIVIVDAYGSPSALADLNIFSTAMGLPAMTANSFQEAYSDGPPSGSDPDWALETTLDIEWAHAFAPEAKIVLVVAPSSDNAELAYGVEYAADHHLGNVVSNSWGLPEAAADASTAQMFDQVFKRAAARGVAVNVATGDSGDNYLGTPLGAPNIPSDSRFATAVGGTSIDVPSDAGPMETAWGTSLTGFGVEHNVAPRPNIRGTVQGSGGGESVYMKKPTWQRNLPGSGRQLPDISAVADPLTGAIIEMTDPNTGEPSWGTIGGTSLATPIFSAIWALADEAAGESLGQAAPVVANMSPFALRDVLPIKATLHNTSASISFRGGAPTLYTPAQLFGLPASQKAGFLGVLYYVGQSPFLGWDDVGFGLDSSLAAAPGWDNATGYGVPNGILFIETAQLFARGLR